MDSVTLDGSQPRLSAQPSAGAGSRSPNWKRLRAMRGDFNNEFTTRNPANQCRLQRISNQVLQ
jgi:hypothetical protein